MMRRLLSYLLVLLVCVDCSCTKESPDEDFRLHDGLCLCNDGKVVFAYEPLTCQVGCNEARGQYWVCSDDMDQYFILSCTGLSREEGSRVTASLKWSVGTGVSSRRDLQFKVIRSDPDGRVWLWSSKSKTGVCVRVL